MSTADTLVADTAQISAAARAISLHSPTFREAYQRILDLHEQVAGTIRDLDAQAAGINPDDAAGNSDGEAPKIDGVRYGARVVYNAVVGTGNGSVRQSLLRVQNDLAKLLNELRESYVTYHRTDHESAANLAGAGKTP